ncbi:MAG: hypothetical protein HY909_06770 [Deltaproteobacteria bacterium]|nr:hypothetical protein [Deltaproteobacteria bacterium]
MKLPSVLLGCLFLVPGALSADPPAEGRRPPCVAVRWSPFLAGEGLYNHLVWVRNGCADSLQCEVRSDVNPQPQRATVRPGEEVLVNTFLNSPARGFRPRVDCAAERAN